jgi:archaellin
MDKKNTPYMNDDRASIGIGAMIVFIALILVVAVVSTIIIKTAEELQQCAEVTGDDTSDEISGKVQLVMAYVSTETAGAVGTVDEITLVVQMAAGSDATLLSDISWLIVCDNGASAQVNTGTLDNAGPPATMFAEDLAGTALTGGSSVAAGQTFTIVINTAANCTPSTGDTQELRLIVDGGGETYAQLSYNDFQAGTLIV